MEEPRATKAGTASDRGWTCATCGLHAEDNYCAHCGEKRHTDHDFSLRHVLAEAAEAFFHVDSKIFGTLKILVTKPGELPAEFFRGRRKPYMSPLQTFFVCNLLFFVLQPLTGLEILAPGLRSYENNTGFNNLTRRLVDRRLAQKHLSRTNEAQFVEFSEKFYHNARLQAKSLILALAPMMALALAILNFRRRRYFTEHLILAVFTYAWWLLWLLVVLVAGALVFVLSSLSGHQMGVKLLDWAATLLEFGGLGVYLFLASRRFYQDKLFFAFAKGVLLAFSGFGFFLLYRFLLFFTVLYST